MDIEEFRPEPPRPLPTKPKRKNLSIVTMGAILVGVFLVTLFVLNRHEPAYGFADRPATDTRQALPAPVSADKPRVAFAAPVPEAIERAAQCLSENALSAQELTQVMRALADETTTATQLSTPALNAGMDPQNVTAEQEAEFTGMLTLIKGPLAMRAQMAFQRGLTDGACKLASLAPVGLPAPKWPSQS